MIGAGSSFRHVSRISRAGFAAVLRQSANPEIVAEREGGQYWDAAIAYGVDPLLLLAMFQHESGMGRLGVASQTRSWGNTRLPSFGAAPAQDARGRPVMVRGRTGLFPAYATWLDGALATVARLARLDYPAGGPYGERISIGEIFEHPSGQVWAPAGNLNDPAGYLASVLSFMNEHEEAAVGGLTIIQTPGTPNMSRGRAGRAARAVVVHIAEGSEAGTIAWFRNPASQVSSHFLVCLDGRIRQFVALTDTAWANGVLNAPDVASSPVIEAWAATPPDPAWPAGLPNLESVSIELEGMTADDPPPPQWASLGRLIALVCQAVGIPPRRDAILGHDQIDSRNKRDCPGLTVGQWADLIVAVQRELEPDGQEDAALEAYWQAHRGVLGEQREPGAGKLARVWGGEKVLLLERGVLAVDRDGVVTDITQRALDDLVSQYWREDGSLIVYGAPTRPDG